MNKRNMHNPAAFVGKHIDSTKWNIPQGYERCALTGKLHHESDLLITFRHYVFERSFLVAHKIYVEDSDWLSEEGYEIIMTTLERLGKLSIYQAWFENFGIEAA